MNKEDIVVELLCKKNFHIAFAESCTGGLCAATLINYPGASAVIDGSIVSYANSVKVKELKVKEETINNDGVVSPLCALEMAIGVKNKFQSEVGVSTTGIAGPTGGSDNKPVGMVCFGFAILDKTYTYTMYFGDIGRNNVRKNSVEFVFDKLIELLND